MERFIQSIKLLIFLSKLYLTFSCSDGCVYCSEISGCNDCLIGYYYEDSDCHECLYGCQMCNSGKDCTSCRRGFYYSSSNCYSCNKQCEDCSGGPNLCTSCKAGKYLSKNQCLSCSTNCRTCKGSANKCLSCQSNSVYLNSNQECVACISPCKTCSNETTCLSCIDDYFFHEGHCNECNSNCKQPIDKCICEICEDGYFLFNQQCLKCDQKCKTCKDSANKCLTCNDKYYLNSNNLCEPCKAPCNTCLSENICTSCVDDYYFFSGNCYQCNLNCKTTFDNCRCAICIEGYYFDRYQCLKCDENCKSCSKSSNKCLSCETGKFLLNNQCINCKSNCLTCSNTEYNCTSCHSNKILFNNTCINCDESCDNLNATEIFEDSINILENEDETKYYDEVLENIESVFTNEFYDTSILERGEEEILETKKLKIVFTTTSNQKNNVNKNISTIDLGQCETLLKNLYNISQEEVLYIKKLDIIQEGMKIPKIEYSVYHKLNGTNLMKLNISICKNITISLILPIDINENLDKLNPKSRYYNDLCYPSTSEKGTDIILKDRQKEYIEENKTVCQDDCDFVDYNYSTKKINCSCKVKEMPLSILDMKINKTKLYEHFIDIKNIANIKMLKCYRRLLTLNSILYNIGSYIIISFIILHIVSIIIFYSRQFDLLKNIIKNIVISLKKIKKEKTKKN